MLLVDRSAPGVLSLNWMWLPSWIGINADLVREIEKAVGEKLVGQEMTEDVLQAAHELVMDFILKRHPHIGGLFEYLDGLKYVTDAP